MSNSEDPVKPLYQETLPMAKATKTAPKKLNKEELAEIEAGLITKYPHIVPGSLRNIETSGKYEGKRTIEIRCQYPGCNKVRRIATSDLAQVKFCEEHTLLQRAERRRERRKGKTVKPKVKAKTTRTKGKTGERRRKRTAVTA